MRRAFGATTLAEERDLIERQCHFMPARAASSLRRRDQIGGREIMLLRRQIAMREALENGLQDASQEARSDRATMLTAVSAVGAALQHCSAALRNDLEVACAAIDSDPTSLRFASEELSNNRDLVLRAVGKVGHGFTFKYASPALRSDKDFVLLALRSITQQEQGPLYCMADGQLKEDCPWETMDAALNSALAHAGEAVPVLSVTLSHENSTEQQRHFKCSALLMSGKRFTCSLLDRPVTDRFGCERPGPTLENLAVALVEELPLHLETSPSQEARKVDRVFISFTGKGIDSDLAAPWDWDRPLSAFVCPASEKALNFPL